MGNLRETQQTVHTEQLQYTGNSRFTWGSTWAVGMALSAQATTNGGVASLGRTRDSSAPKVRLVGQYGTHEAAFTVMVMC